MVTNPERSSAGSSDEALAVSAGATVTKNLISIEIHEDIYSHIERYLASGDYFHAVEEAYKVVRERLRELTGYERSTDIFNSSAQSDKHYAALFGKSTPSNPAEGDFFRGIGYLHLGIQFLRNEKAHSLATFLEPNLAIHYISLASLTYDLISRHVSDESIAEIEELVEEIKKAYRTNRAFYIDYEKGAWLDKIALPPIMRSRFARKALKEKWVDEADLTRSWDSSVLTFMRLELVPLELNSTDIDTLLALPTIDSYGNDQLAGMLPFLRFIERERPDLVSNNVQVRIQGLEDR